MYARHCVFPEEDLRQFIASARLFKIIGLEVVLDENKFQCLENGLYHKAQNKCKKACLLVLTVYKFLHLIFSLTPKFF